MRMLRPLSVLVVLAAAGCAESAVPPPAFAPVPPAATRPGGTWQQFCEQTFSVAQASLYAATRGADGWELVAMYNGVLCYKRPGSGEPPSRVYQPTPAPGSPYVPVVRDPGF